MVIKYYSILWKAWRLFFPFPNTACIKFRRMSCSLSFTAVFEISSDVPVSFPCSTSVIFSPLVCPDNILSFLLCSSPSTILLWRLGWGSTLAVWATQVLGAWLTIACHRPWTALKAWTLFWLFGDFCQTYRSLPFLRTKSGLNWVANFKVTFGRLAKMHRKKKPG